MGVVGGYACRTAAAAAAAAAGDSQSADGVPAGKTDVTEPARLLVATVKALKVRYNRTIMCTCRSCSTCNMKFA